MLRDEVKRTGATRYNSRRLIEMYSVASVLQAAKANPSENSPTYNINGEPAVPKGKFVRENAETMADILRSLSTGRIMVPSSVQNTGWKEISQQEYQQRQSNRIKQMARSIPPQ